MSIVYDAGVLVAADRASRSTWVDHRVRLEAGLLPVTTAPVVAQTSRSPRQAQLPRFLRGCEIVDFATEDAHRVGALLSAAGLADVVDAHLIITASDRSLNVLTSDLDDLERLADAAENRIEISQL